MKKRTTHAYVATALITSVLTIAATCLPASAGVIVGATSATINSGGPGFGSISDTFNQAGLFTPYISQVTDFDTYIASVPLHTSVFAGFEWFSELGTTSASVTYDLGDAMSIDAVALWNEEAAGIGLLDLLFSTDGITFTPLASGLTPTDHPTHPFLYPPDVFEFAPVNARYIRFDASSCPQQPPDFISCAIGEVAFRSTALPEPPSLMLVAVALTTLAAFRKNAPKSQVRAGARAQDS